MHVVAYCNYSYTVFRRSTYEQVLR